LKTCGFWTDVDDTALTLKVVLYVYYRAVGKKDNFNGSITVKLPKFKGINAYGARA
jgi:hypothetical protein